MLIQPTHIEQSGPGIGLSNQPEGLSVRMSDPVEGFEYARNAVTLVYDLSDYAHVRLMFEAKEFGDEPHAPPPSPFADDVNFDGVAVSADGVDWHEIQDLRSLRSDRYIAFDIDLDAAITQWGLEYGAAFRIRFCQYDNNPAPMDGIFIQGIELQGDLRPPILHLTMDDNSATPMVLDATTGGHHQTFTDASGDPNTNVHSVPGVVATALSFDGVDDRITLTPESYRHALAANRDFSICLWWKTNAPDSGQTLHFLSNYSGTESCIFAYTVTGRLYLKVSYVTAEVRRVGPSWAGGADDAWHHYAVTRKAAVLSFYRDGVLAVSDDHPENVLSLTSSDRELTIGSPSGGGQASPGLADDLRIYDRALSADEIQGLHNLGS